ncbi:uncharacterized protein LOC142621223 [Castanea sativa]|uniref:uncharacterized protein LOC142621223 n=1 Tax=Castanea sativa TaxID=21020 RepID=UPI003F64EB0A
MTWAMHQLGELRRNRQGKLKRKCYKDDASREDVIQSRPDWADETEFIQLVDYWFHEDTRTLSSTNKRSRGKQKEIARSGPISFAQTADDMAKETGQAVERAVLFAKVYSTKEGHPVTPDVGEKIKQMTEILNRGSSLQGSRHEGILWSKDDTFAQVMGAERSGRVRGVGFRPTPSGRNGSNRSCYTLPPSSIETAHRMTELETSHQTLKDQLAQVEQRHQEQMADLHERHKAELTSAIAQSEAKHQMQMAEVMKTMGDMLRDLRPLISASQLQSQDNTASK